MYKNLINGEWVGSTNAAQNINPSDTSDIIGEYATAGVAQTIDAIAAATAAFPSWSRGPIQARADLLERIGNEILLRKDEIGILLAREEGKILSEAVGEALRAAQIFKFYAQEVLRFGGQLGPSVRPGVNVEVTREALGVIGIITPWNYPIAIPAWKIAPALAYGNCVVFKPAELVPGCGWLLADIIKRAGVPDGVFNLVMGSGSVVGQTLLDHKEVSAITFTGSVATGQRVAQACIERMAKFQLEMGSKNPLLILADADLDNAVKCAINGAFFSTGQRCTATSRIIVEKPIEAAFIEALTRAMGELTVGDARAPGTDMGPVVDQRQLDQDLRYIDLGASEGATLASGGQRVQREQQGFYLAPTLLTNCANDMRIAREEIFGPVACVMTADDYEHGLHLANDSEFGLCAGICTGSLKHAAHFKRNAQTGMVMVNLPTAGVDYHVPFGGRKASSYGAREQGKNAEEFFTTVKTSYVFADLPG